MTRGVDDTNLPWYRHAWVWFVMTPPAAAVLAGVITAWLAGGPPALVVDDYSEIALTSERRHARDERARQLALQAEVQLPPAGSASGAVRVVLSSPTAGFSGPDRLQLQLIHPTREELDRVVTLSGSDNTYTGWVTRPANRYYVELADDSGDWRLVGELPARSASLRLTPTRAAGGRK